MRIYKAGKMRSVFPQFRATIVNQFYAALLYNDMRLFRAFANSGLVFESGFSDDHYWKKNGVYCGADFPLPVIEVIGVCDVFSNVESIDFYAFVPNDISDEVIRRFHILEVIILQERSRLMLYRMSSDENEETVVGFAKELKNMGATV